MMGAADLQLLGSMALLLAGERECWWVAGRTSAACHLSNNK
jgi:hypothetical protein